MGANTRLAGGLTVGLIERLEGMGPVESAQSVGMISDSVLWQFSLLFFTEKAVRTRLTFLQLISYIHLILCGITDFSKLIKVL